MIFLDFGAVLGHKGGVKFAKKRPEINVEKRIEKSRQMRKTHLKVISTFLKTISSFLGPAVSRRPAEGGGGKLPDHRTFWTTEVTLSKTLPSGRSAADLNRCAETAAPQKRGRKIMGR